MRVKTVVLAVIAAFVASAARAEDVFMSLTRTPVAMSAVPSNVTVIDRRELEESSARNVAEVLERETSLHIVKTADLGSVQQVNIRGFSSTRVLVLVDGRPLRNLFTGTIDLSQIPLDSVERIEVVRGATSALYGQNATGGVIHVITKRGTEPSANVETQFGSFGTQIYRAQAGAKAGKFDLTAGGSRSRTDGFRQNSDFENWSGDSILGFDGGTFGRTEVKGSFVESETGAPGALALHPSAYDGEAERASTAPNDRQDDRDRAIHVQHQLPIGENRHLTARLFWNQHDQGFKNEFFGSPFFTRSHAVDRKAELQADLPRGIVLGAEYENAVFTNDFNPRYATDIWSGYGQHTGHWGDRWLTIVGVRGDHDSNFGESINPRLTLMNQRTDQMRFSLNAGRAFRAPTFADLFTPSANPDIRPEKTWSVDVGLDHRPTADTHGSLTFFHTWTDDRIVTDAGNSFRSQNLADAFTRGIETKLEMPLAGPVRHGLSYTFTQARGRREGYDYTDLPLTPRHKGIYAWELNNLAGFTMRSAWTYIGENYFANFDASDRTVLPDAFLWDIRVAFQIKAVEAFFLVQNVLERRYALNANPPEFGGGFYPQPGRVFSGGLRLRFGANRPLPDAPQS
jgi:outer membrane cobalamin receptor